MLLAGLLLIWLNQGSLERFWQQKYHQDTPWAKMAGNPIWDYGAYLHDGALEAGSVFTYHASGQKAQDAQQAAELALANKNKKLSFPDGFQVDYAFYEWLYLPSRQLINNFP